MTVAITALGRRAPFPARLFSVASETRRDWLRRSNGLTDQIGLRRPVSHFGPAGDLIARAADARKEEHKVESVSIFGADARNPSRSEGGANGRLKRAERRLPLGQSIRNQRDFFQKNKIGENRGICGYSYLIFGGFFKNFISLIIISIQFFQ